MTRAADIVIESPYALDGEFGPLVEGPEADAWATARLAHRASFHYGISEPQFVDEARAAAKGLAQASGQAGYVPPAAKPVQEKALERSLEFVDAARDRLMRSRRAEEPERPMPPRVAPIVPLPAEEPVQDVTETSAEEAK